MIRRLKKGEKRSYFIVSAKTDESIYEKSIPVGKRNQGERSTSQNNAKGMDLARTTVCATQSHVRWISNKADTTEPRKEEESSWASKGKKGGGEFMSVKLVRKWEEGSQTVYDREMVPNGITGLANEDSYWHSRLGGKYGSSKGGVKEWEKKNKIPQGVIEKRKGYSANKEKKPDILRRAGKRDGN